MRPNYPRRYDRVIGIQLVQLLWDRGETNGYANHVTALEALSAWLEATFPAPPAVSAVVPGVAQARLPGRRCGRKRAA